MSTSIRANKCIASGALTNSKRPESFVRGVYPTHLISGSGAFLTDVNGKRFVDFICGLGASLYGYNHHLLTDIGVKAESLGCTLSLSTKYEVETAERVQEFFPVMHKMRFLKTGSEACTAAVTIARSYTKRSVVLSDAYHGWNPEFVSLTPPAFGCVPNPYIKKLVNNQVDLSVAAVIIEPVITDFSDERRKWLTQLREQCTRFGTLLIFDETITALRFPGLSVSKYFNIEPDLMVFGKALGGGSALACVGGRADVMDSEYFVSSTFAGEIGPIMKAHKVLEMAKITHPIDRLWEFGKSFWSGFNSILEGHVQYEGYPTRGILTGDPFRKALFMQEACKAGLLFGASPFLMYPHIQMKEEIFSILRDVALKLKIGNVKLQGEMPKTAFAAKVRQQ